jgi:hypothetical protein
MKEPQTAFSLLAADSIGSLFRLQFFSATKIRKKTAASRSLEETELDPACGTLWLTRENPLF